MLIPSATRSTTVATGIRVPRMHGKPAMTPGPTVMRSNVTLQGYRRGPTRWPESAGCGWLVGLHPGDADDAGDGLTTRYVRSLLNTTFTDGSIIPSTAPLNGTTASTSSLGSSRPAATSSRTGPAVAWAWTRLIS